MLPADPRGSHGEQPHRADFCYEERGEVCAGGAGGSCEYVWRKVVEDVKCRATRTQKYITEKKVHELQTKLNELGRIIGGLQKHFINNR